MLRLESAMWKTSKQLLMLNGRSFMRNYKRFALLVQILSSLSCLLEILQPNGLQIGIFSALEESPMKILIVLPRPQEHFYRLLSITSLLLCLELAEDSRRNRLVQKDTIFLRNAPMYSFIYQDQISNHYFAWWC